MKQRLFLKKLEYYFMYYKLPVLIGLTLLSVSGYLIYAKCAEKSDSFQVILFDIHTDADDRRLADLFAEAVNLDQSEYDVEIETNLLLTDGTTNYAMASKAKYYSMVGTQKLDVCMMLEEDFKNYEKADAFLDLREVFSEEELACFPDLCYDAEGHCIGIYGSSLPKIKEIHGYENQKSIMGILYNSRHKELSAQYLRYLGTVNSNVQCTLTIDFMLFDDVSNHD